MNSGGIRQIFNWLHFHSQQAVDVIRQSGNVVVFTVQSLIAFEGGSSAVSAADESTQQVIDWTKNNATFPSRF